VSSKRAHESAYKKMDVLKMDVLKLGHIEDRQLSYMLVFLLASKIFLRFPSSVAARAGTAAWVSVALAAILAFFALQGWLLWTRDTGKLGFVPSLRLTLGRVLGDLVALMTVVHLILTTALSIRVFGGGAVIGLLPEIPIEILLFTLIAAAAYGAWLGLEVPARAAVFFFPLIIGTFFLVVIGGYRLIDLRHIYPILGFGLKKTVLAGLTHTGFFGPISAAVVWKTYLREPNEIGRATKMGLLLAGIFMILSALFVAAIFPYPESTRQMTPLGVMARAVYLGPFLQRIEAVFTFSWFFASAVHGSIGYILVFILLSQLMNTRTYRPLVPGTIILTFGIAAIPGSLFWASRLIEDIYLSLGNVEAALGWVLFLAGRLGGVRKKAEALSEQLTRLKEDPSYSEDQVRQKGSRETPSENRDAHG